ncbi:MAG: hypothetical protein F6K55_25010 [Moorea sp. SIO4A3]|nr:hypothetical protein [Moorena sp. SIO4A3]
MPMTSWKIQSEINPPFPVLMQSASGGNHGRPRVGVPPKTALPHGHLKHHHQVQVTRPPQDHAASLIGVPPSKLHEFKT